MAERVPGLHYIELVGHPHQILMLQLVGLCTVQFTVRTVLLTWSTIGGSVHEIGYTDLTTEYVRLYCQVNNYNHSKTYKSQLLET